MKVTFYGAASEVTGSCFLIETDDHKKKLKPVLVQVEDIET